MTSSGLYIPADASAEAVQAAHAELDAYLRRSSSRPASESRLRAPERSSGPIRWRTSSGKLRRIEFAAAPTSTELRLDHWRRSAEPALAAMPCWRLDDLIDFHADRAGPSGPHRPPSRRLELWEQAVASIPPPHFIETLPDLDINQAQKVSHDKRPRRTWHHADYKSAEVRAMIESPGRRGIWIIPLGGRHPFASHGSIEHTSRPVWTLDDQRPAIAPSAEPTPLHLSPLRLHTLWRTLSGHIREGPWAGRLGPARLKLVRTLDSHGARTAYITLEVESNRYQHVLGLLIYRCLVQPTNEPVLRDVRLMWVDLLLKEPLLIA